MGNILQEIMGLIADLIHLINNNIILFIEKYENLKYIYNIHINL